MFHSPSIRVFTSENTDSLVQRKPGNVLTRKPFLDRSVNSKTPDTGKLQKPKLSFAEKSKVSCSKEKEDLNAEDVVYSFKDGDCYDNIWPKSQRFGTEKIVEILRNYCNVENTPPPSPEPVPLEIDPIFFDVPDIQIPVFQLEKESVLNETFDMDVDIPQFNNLDLDISL